MTLDERLSRIETMWSVVRNAHADEAAEMRKAQEQMLRRYGHAIQRYLLAALRDENAADEVYQEFALRFVRGDFQSADPARGRFRSYLKTILFRMVADYHRARKRDRVGQLVDEAAHEKFDREPPGDAFEQTWRDELLKRAWSALSRSEKDESKPLFNALLLRVDGPDRSSAEIAEQLSQRLGKPISVANLRVMVYRARERFADLLLDEVVHSLADATRESLEQELIDLRLQEYCRPALERRPE